jgi:hypothetical protein
MALYPAFLRALQNMASKKAPAMGWQKVREVIKMARTIRSFQPEKGEDELHDMLMFGKGLNLHHRVDDES